MGPDGTWGLEQANQYIGRVRPSSKCGEQRNSYDHRDGSCRSEQVGYLHRESGGDQRLGFTGLRERGSERDAGIYGDDSK